jgi:hypothetical protein
MRVFGSAASIYEQETIDQSLLRTFLEVCQKQFDFLNKERHILMKFWAIFFKKLWEAKSRF